MAIAIGLSLVEETHGLILLVPLALGIGWVVWRRRRAASRRRALAEIEAHRRAVSKDLSSLMQLSPYEFEHAVAAVLRAAGYTDVEVTRGSGDRGIDVVGVDLTGQRTVVQCKRYVGKVGGPAVRNLAGSRVQAGAARAMLVTTARFTREAYEASRLTGVDLMDGEQFVTLARAFDQSETAASVTGSESGAVHLVRRGRWAGCLRRRTTSL